MSSINAKSTSRIKVNLYWHVALYEVYIAGTNLCIGMVQEHRSDNTWDVYDVEQDLIHTVQSLDAGVEYLKHLYESEVN